MPLPTPEELETLDEKQRRIYQRILESKGEQQAEDYFKGFAVPVAPTPQVDVQIPAPEYIPPQPQPQQLRRGIGGAEFSPLGPDAALTETQREVVRQRQFTAPRQVTELQQSAFAEALEYAGSQLGLPYEKSVGTRKGLREQAFEEWAFPEIVSPETPEEMTLFRRQEKHVEDFIKDQIGETLTAEQYAFQRVYGDLSPRQARTAGFEKKIPPVSPSRIDLMREPERATGMGFGALLESLKPQIVSPGEEVRAVREQALAIRQDALEGIETFGTAENYFDELRQLREEQINDEILKAQQRGGIGPTEIVKARDEASRASVALTREMINKTFPKTLDEQDPGNKTAREELLALPQFGGGDPFYEENSYFTAIGDTFNDMLTNQPNERLRADMVDAGLISDPDAITESTLGTILRDIGGLSRGLVVKPLVDTADYIDRTMSPIIENIGMAGIAAAEIAPTLAYEIARGVLGEEMVGRVPETPEGQMKRDEALEIVKVGKQLSPFGLFLGERVDPEKEESPFDMAPFGTRYISPTGGIKGYIEELAVETATGRGLGNDVVGLKKFEGANAAEELFVAGTIMEMFLPMTPLQAGKEFASDLQALAKTPTQMAAATLLEVPFAPWSASKKIMGRGLGGTKQAKKIADELVTATSRTAGRAIADVIDDPLKTAKNIASVNEAMVDIAGDVVVGLRVVANPNIQANKIIKALPAQTQKVIVALQKLENPSQAALGALQELASSSPLFRKANQQFETAMQTGARADLGSKVSLTGVINVAAHEMKSAMKLDLAKSFPEDYYMLTPRVLVSTRWLDENFPEIQEIMRRFNKSWKYNPEEGMYESVKQVTVGPGRTEPEMFLTPAEYSAEVQRTIERFAGRQGAIGLVGEAEDLVSVAQIPVDRRLMVSAQDVSKGISSYIASFKKNVLKIKNNPPAKGKVKSDIDSFKRAVANFDGALKRNILEELRLLRKELKGASTSEVIYQFTVRNAAQIDVSLDQTYFDIVKSYFGANVINRSNIGAVIKEAIRTTRQRSRQFRSLDGINIIIEKVARIAPEVTGSEKNISDVLLAYAIDAKRSDGVKKAALQHLSEYSGEKLTTGYGGAVLKGSRNPSLNMFDDENIILGRKFVIEYASRLLSRSEGKGMSRDAFDAFVELFRKKNLKEAEFRTFYPEAPKKPSGIPKTRRAIGFGRREEIIEQPFTVGGTGKVGFEGEQARQIELLTPAPLYDPKLPLALKMQGELLANRILANVDTTTLSPTELKETIRSFLIQVDDKTIIIPPGVLDSDLKTILSTQKGYVYLDQTLKTPAAALTLQKAVDFLSQSVKGSWVQGQLAGKFVPNFGYQVSNAVTQSIMTFITAPAYAINVAGELVRPAINRKSILAAAQENPNGASRATGYSNQQLLDLLRGYNLGSTGDNVYLNFTLLNDMKAAATSGYNVILNAVKGKGSFREAKYLLDKTVDWLSGTRTSPWSEFASEVDYSVREGVFISALNNGNTPEVAARLAREAQFDYGKLPQWLRSTLGSFALYMSFAYVSMSEVISAAFKPGGANRISLLANAHTQVSNAFHEYKGEDEQILSKVFVYPTFIHPTDEVTPVNTYFNDPFVGSLNLLGDVVLRGIAATNENDYNSKVIKLAEGSLEAAYSSLYLPIFDLKDELRELDYKKAVPAKSVETMRLYEQYLFGEGSMLDFFDLEVVPLTGMREGRAQYDEKQYRFKSDEGRRKFVYYTTIMTALGANRMINDIVGAKIAAGDLPEGSHFGYLTQDPETYRGIQFIDGAPVAGALYLFAGERAIRAPKNIENGQRTLQATRRELRDLQQSFK